MCKTGNVYSFLKLQVIHTLPNFTHGLEEDDHYGAWGEKIMKI